MEARSTKRQQSVELHLNNPDLTQREIAEQVGADQSVVSRAITQYYRTRERAGREER